MAMAGPQDPGRHGYEQRPAMTVLGSLIRLVPGAGLTTSVAMRTGSVVVNEISTVLAAAERVAIRAIRDHVDQVDPRPAPLPMLEAARTEQIDVGKSHETEVRPSSSTTLNDLLHRSMYDSPRESREALHRVLLNGLVPDEARILAALSDGSTYPLLHVAEPGIGGGQRRVLENASSVGRAAGVVRNDCTPMYVTRLMAAGLVVLVPEETARRDDYETLLSESVVRSAVDSVSRGPLQARIIRRTLRISELGRELWEAAQ